MDIENISISEMLVVLLVEELGGDASTAIQKLRTAQAKFLEHAGANTPEEATATLHDQLGPEQIESVLAKVSQNGRVDLFH